LTLVATTIWLAVLYFPDKRLHLIACDVGQGDAILAVYGNTQILVDGGPNNSVLECLERFMPFWDREIELVVLTHPQTDHFTGLIEVFRRYKVEKILANSIDSGSSAYQALKKEIEGNRASVINPENGMVISVGLMQLDILHPSYQYFEEIGAAISPQSNGGVLGAYTTKRDPNDFSIVAILSYKDFDALLTGDIGPDISNQIAKELISNASREIEYIKIPHHGSKNGISNNLLDASHPEIAVISAGRNNRYGHPHQEVIKLLRDKEIKIMRTDEMGDVEIITDGSEWWLPEDK
jgi:competence protein ComEC